MGELRGKRAVFAATHSKESTLVSVLVFMLVIHVIFTGNGPPAKEGPHEEDFVDPSLVNDGNPAPKNCSPLSPKVIVYNRIPKAGSTTLLTLLQQMSETNGFNISIPVPKHDPNAARAAIQEALEANGTTVVVQHFHFPDIIDNRLAYFNVMRHPVERCISAYYYLRFGPRNETAKGVSLRRYGNLTLDRCLRRPFEKLETCFNCPSQSQARFFCGPEGGICDKPPAEEMLRRAWFTMDTQYFVGLTEDLPSTVFVLQSLYPDFFKGMSAALSVTEPARVNNGTHPEPQKSTRRKIAQWTAVDMELYRRSEARLRELHAACEVRNGKDDPVAAVKELQNNNQAPNSGVTQK